MKRARNKQIIKDRRKSIQAIRKYGFHFTSFYEISENFAKIFSIVIAGKGQS
jgi:acetate kinase